MGETLQATGIAGVLRQALSGTGIAPWRTSSQRQNAVPANPAGSERSRRWLVLRSMVEHGVVPNLLKTHLREYAVDTRPMSLELDKHQNGVSSVPMLDGARSLAKHVAFGHRARAEDLVNQYRHDGVSPEELCLQLLQPAAQELGQMWSDDRCSFTHVTLGTLSLQTMLHELAEDFRRPVHAEHNIENALLTTVPGEQHGFGLSMAAEFLRAEGWDITNDSFASAAELEAAVAAQPYTLLGLSAGHTDQIEDLKALISGVRRAAANSKMAISVGGPAFMADPELGSKIGADWVAQDARQAALKARLLVTDT